MSAATLITACGDIRKISKYCMFMIHQSSYGISGNHEQVKREVEQMESEEKLWAKWMAEMSNKTAAYWYKIVKNKNVYLTAEEVLKHKIVDEII